ncbi:hypothetical protein DFH07DRAFT_969201 [Mycena maculata]|uniref:Uncharacterized protein n=1 Tax=Mycena maculata TaxID=230809 RepID=A0AAD7MSR0_9AGAR|nr:hypothetical protein DFH07DRAFT_969201 [Mycena maculata]
MRDHRLTDAYSTSPLQGFDQIVAVSQDHINASLDSRFSLDEKLLKLEVNVHGRGKLDAHMTPPTVVLFIANEPAKAHFCLHFDGGDSKFTYYTINDHADPPTVDTHSVDIKDWTLAFTVNLSLEVLGKIPPEISKKITVPGSYSVSQLLLDFTTSDLTSFDRDLSTTPGLAKPLGQDSERDDALATFINIYLRNLTQSTHNVLGYAITVPDPSVANPIAPTFPPTSVRFQTMANQPKVPGKDCFLFLEMTDKRAFPTSPYIGWTWNWVGESPRQSASMVLAKANFWDAFFVPRATFLNRLALDMLNRVAYSIDSRKLDHNPAWTLGSTVPDSGLAWKTKDDKSMKWDWSYSTSSHRDQLRPYTHRFDTNVDVALDIAKNAITMTSKSHVWREDIAITPLGREVIKNTTVIDATVSWGFVFTLESVADGALGVRTTASPEDCSVTETYNGNIGRYNPFSDQELAQFVKDRIKDGLSSNTLEQDVKDAFKHQAQFVFPGGGTFFMKDPAFNESGDIVVGLEYKQE